MKSLILQISARYIKWLLFLFSIYLLMRGHNMPGGGFEGGLMAGSAFVLEAIAYDVALVRKKLFLPTQSFIGMGLLISVVSGIFGLLKQTPFMTGQWIDIHLGDFHVHLGAPILFDLGVYFVVFGVTLTIILGLMEE